MCVCASFRPISYHKKQLIDFVETKKYWTLPKSCGSQSSEWEERKKSRAKRGSLCTRDGSLKTVTCHGRVEPVYHQALLRGRWRSWRRNGRRAGLTLRTSPDSHIDFVFIYFSLKNRQSLRQPVDGCGGARSRRLQVSMSCSISCLVRHVSRKVFSLCMHVNRFFSFSLLAFTPSYCHPRHAMACSFGRSCAAGRGGDP